MQSIARALIIGLVALATGVPHAYAALTIHTTRIVFDSAQRNASVIIGNPSNRVYAAQAWVNTGADDATTAVPLIASPSLFRLNAGSERVVQLAKLPNDLPNDRESLFFFNLQEVPEALAAEQNSLNIALRTRIKVFYRPSQLSSTPEQTLNDLRFSVKTINGQAHLHIVNPTPFHYTFSRLELSAADQKHTVSDADMLAPMSEESYPMPENLRTLDLQVELSVITDYGNSSAPMVLPVHYEP
ncbi:molecular chaperone [Pseudomonas sp. NY15372]|uniref:fimbrial biogenesis chaperone n=1 Tax=Pseudomonas sp. NY15372 TaxID=3400356 RepID=UPI003A85A536